MGQSYLIASIAVLAAATFITRLFPFVALSRLHTHPMVQALGLKLPVMIMPVLVVYCVKDLSTRPEYISAAVSLIVVCALQFKFQKALLSVFFGTIFYMVLLKIFA